MLPHKLPDPPADKAGRRLGNRWWHGWEVRGTISTVQAAGHKMCIRDRLKAIGLFEYRDTMAGNLAYGMQRKVEIARALALEPYILVLDEPAAVSYTHLDVYKRQGSGCAVPAFL